MRQARLLRKAVLRIESTWKQWPCYIPQHGPGLKHNRKIELVAWQKQSSMLNLDRSCPG
jgi:hypothetical protein